MARKFKMEPQISSAAPWEKRMLHLTGLREWTEVTNTWASGCSVSKFPGRSYELHS